MKIPILTYHSMHISGNDYANNDVVALRSDLRHITDRGFEVWPLHSVISAWLNDADPLEGSKIIALSCDDGPDFDFRDLVHPSAGKQRSVINVLFDFQAERPREQLKLNITSFVVTSPKARDVLDETCMIGQGWWNDDWWGPAITTSLMDIANHSWDHNHDTLPPLDGVKRGTFTTIDNKQLADYEIKQAADFIWSKAPNRGAALFAYPYGEFSQYLVEEYLPRNASELRLIAAFTDKAGYLSRSTNRWTIPRFVFGRDWVSPDGLDVILDEASTGQPSSR